MRTSKVNIWIIVIYSLSVSCSEFEYNSSRAKIIIDEPVVADNHISLQNMRYKAMQIATIQWVPLARIPNLTGYFEPGHTYYGIPYSSVKEKDKFIGLEVSFHTFMTAIHNPRSSLYTENVSTYPYCGENCGTYYGTVCSMAVNYAIGIDMPIQSDMYRDLPYFAEVKNQDIDGLYPGDILWSNGHVVLALDVHRGQSGMVDRVEILESAGRTFIKEYNRFEFMERWRHDRWVALRYLNLSCNLVYEPSQFIPVDDEILPEPKYNDDLCISRGDKACFLEGEDVIVNIFNPDYKVVELYHNNELYKILEYQNKDIRLNDLPYGHYKVRLVSDLGISDFTYFEVINVSVEINQSHKNTMVYFKSCNASPCYIVICEKDGFRKALYSISVDEQIAGIKEIRRLNKNEKVKVFFQGEYGKVSNNHLS